MRETIESVTAPIETTCRGINQAGKPVLENPINVQIEIIKEPFFNTNIVESRINCPYITGGHRNKCKAFDPEETGRYDINCKYSFSFFTQEKNRGEQE